MKACCSSLLRWLLSHSEELLQLLEVPQRLKDAADLAARLEVIKWAIDVLIPIVGDLPTSDAQHDIDEATLEANAFELQQDATAQGIDWGQLVALLPIIVKILDLLMGDDESEAEAAS